MNAATHEQRLYARQLVAKAGVYGHGIITNQRSNNYFNPQSNYLVETVDDGGDESHYDISDHDIARLEDDGNPHVEVYE